MSQLARAIDDAATFATLGPQFEAPPDEVAPATRCASDQRERIRRAIGLHRERKFYAARALYESALRNDASNPDLLHLLGLVHLQLDDCPAALKHLQRAITLRPDSASYYSSLSQAHLTEEQFREAVAAADVALRLNPNLLAARLSLGFALCSLGQRAQAQQCFQSVLQLLPDNLSALTALAVLAERENRLDDARSFVEPQLHRAPRNVSLLLTAARLQRRSGKLLDALHSLERARAAAVADKERVHIYFALGRTCDELGDADRAARCFVRAKKLKLEGKRHDRSAVRSARRNLIRLSQAFAPDRVRDWSAVPSFPRANSPIVVIGFPRSGNTLLDQILNCHGQLRTALEQPLAEAAQRVIEELPGGYPDALATLSAADARRAREAYFAAADRLPNGPPRTLVDTYPANTWRVAMLYRLFPQTKFVFMLRHPCDVVLSCFMQNFADREISERFHSLQDIAELYTRVMDLWEQHRATLPLDAHVVRYERLVDDFETETRALCRHLEIPWEPTLSRFAERAMQRRELNTASYDQVTQPLYQHACGRWRRYAKYLAPVLPILRPCAERYGYPLNLEPEGLEPESLAATRAMAVPTPLPLPSLAFEVQSVPDNSHMP